MRLPCDSWSLLHTVAPSEGGRLDVWVRSHSRCSRLGGLGASFLDSDLWGGGPHPLWWGPSPPQRPFSASSGLASVKRREVWREGSVKGRHRAHLPRGQGQPASLHRGWRTPERPAAGEIAPAQGPVSSGPRGPWGSPSSFSHPSPRSAQAQGTMPSCSRAMTEWPLGQGQGARSL